MDIKPALLIICLSLLWYSCRNDESSKMTLVNKRVEERTMAFRQQSVQECHILAMEKANALVDSILINRIKLIHPDTLTIPDKPTKPGRPDFSLPPDTIIQRLQIKEKNKTKKKKPS